MYYRIFANGETNSIADSPLTICLQPGSGSFARHLGSFYYMPIDNDVPLYMFFTLNAACSTINGANGGNVNSVSPSTLNYRSDWFCGPLHNPSTPNTYTFAACKFPITPNETTNPLPLF